MSLQQGKITLATKNITKTTKKHWSDDGAFNSFIKELGATIYNSTFLLFLPPLLDKVEVSGISAIIFITTKERRFLWSMTHKYTYQDKQFALSSGFHLKQRKISNYFFRNEISLERQIKIRKLFSKRYCSWDLVSNLNSSRYKKKAVIQKRILPWIKNGDAIFITITFDNKGILETTSEHTRRRYVSRWLKSTYRDYVANIDYGDKNGREHYHAVVNAHNGDIPDNWDYGFIRSDLVRIKGNSDQRLSKYLSKLTHHAIKNSGMLKRVIYSKKIV
jgi:hypothetical protein